MELSAQDESMEGVRPSPQRRRRHSAAFSVAGSAVATAMPKADARGATLMRSPVAEKTRRTIFLGDRSSQGDQSPGGRRTNVPLLTLSDGPRLQVIAVLIERAVSGM